MALLNIQIPDGVAWADFFEHVPLPNVAVEDDDGWAVSGKKKEKVVAVVQPPQRWCRDGNACPWLNCKFRHERCSHYDNWLARGKKGACCRAWANDPFSSKRPDEGGCLYDHRNPSQLKVYHETLPCSTEEELWDSFYEKKLRLHVSDVYDLRRMRPKNRDLLVRSLIKAGVSFEDCGDHMYIDY